MPEKRNSLGDANRANSPGIRLRLVRVATAHDAITTPKTMKRGCQNPGFSDMTSSSQLFFDRNRGY